MHTHPVKTDAAFAKSVDKERATFKSCTSKINESASSPCAKSKMYSVYRCSEFCTAIGNSEVTWLDVLICE